MALIPPSSRIAEFWAWFAVAAPRLVATKFGDQTLLQELEARVSKLGPIGWELGPGRELPCSLVLTPDGRPELLATTEAVISSAPSIPGFELYPARPPKQWDLRFSIGDSRGGELEVDARSWRYVLFRHPDGLFDVLIEEPNMRECDDDERALAATVVVDGILGERERLRSIMAIDATITLEAPYDDSASEIGHLAEHWKRML